MFSLRKMFTPSRPAAPRAPDGVTIYAVGDIHGRAELLDMLLEGVARDAESHDEECVCVCVGDYVDRGAKSKEVVELLLALRDSGIFECRFLRGNHDQSVLDFLFDPATGPGWCDFGGRDTLISYGVKPPRQRTDLEGWSKTAAEFAAALPPTHAEFFRNLEPFCEYGDYFFAHAGVRPGVPLEDQAEHDLMWIRQPFLDDPRALPKVVVHGHTPAETVHSDRRRIGIDTGAYATDVLTAVKLTGAEQSLIQTVRRPDRSLALALSAVGEDA